MSWPLVAAEYAGSATVAPSRSERFVVGQSHFPVDTAYHNVDTTTTLAHQQYTLYNNKTMENRKTINGGKRKMEEWKYRKMKKVEPSTFIITCVTRKENDARDDHGMHGVYTSSRILVSTHTHTEIEHS